MEYNESFAINHNLKLYFGVGASEKLGSVLKEYHSRKVIFIADPVMVQLGYADKLKDNMEAAGMQVSVFSEIKGEPDVDTCNEAILQAKEFGADAVAALGGGSACDIGKIVGLLLGNEGDLLDHVRGGKYFAKGRHFDPIICLPTTAGTSADITIGAVLSVNGKKSSVKSRASVSIVDPQFTYGLPASITATTGIDAMCHAVESFTNHTPNWMADLMEETAIELIYKYLPRAYKDGSDEEARVMMSYAVALTGYGFADRSTTVGHALANAICDKYHLTHGVACALGLFAVVRYNVCDNPEKMARIAKAIGIDTAGKTSEEYGREVVAAFDQFQKDLGFKTMKEMGIPREFLEKAAKDLPENYRFKGNKYAPNFEYVTKAILESADL